MGIYSVKPAFQKKLAPVVSWCIQSGIHPTTLNVLGFVASVGIAAAIVLSPYSPYTLLAVPLFAFVRTAINALDGQVARGQGFASPIGEVQNETVDRISDALIFLSFFCVPGVYPELVGLTVAAILLTSYLAVVSKAAGGPRLYDGWMGKADRMIVLGAGALLALLFDPIMTWIAVLIVVAGGSVFTFVERARRAYHELAR